jgi:serine/threonine protein phosphatase PrpC
LKDIRAADVCPSLVPRASHFTPPYIEAAPTVVSFDRSPGSVLVLASDGLWDYLSPEEVTQVVEILIGDQDAPKIAQELVDKALSVAAEATELSVSELKSMEPGIEKRSIHDDITAIVLLL